MNAPITYVQLLSPKESDHCFARLSEDLAWVRHSTGNGKVPRMEYFVNRAGTPYTYGKGAFARTYQPGPMHIVIEEIMALLYMRYFVTFEVCFLNRYLNASDHLGWHSDDSPEMDDARPIAIVSLGAERDILFRKIGDDSGDPERRTLAHGSLCLMAAGMQDTHQHRIPKSQRQCKERISLTFRGLVLPDLKTV